MSDDTLLRLAGAITDGRVPDWGGAESTATTDEERQLVDELRILASLAAVHQGSPLSTAPAEPSDVVDADPVRWGPLEIREKIGSGHFGTVYLAWDSALERQAALKLLRESSGTAEVIREGRLLARVRHPNVVTVYGVDQHDGAVGLWMEFVDGLTLSRLLATFGALSARDATLIGIDLCGAVTAVHKAGLLHRDIKAQNVMRDGSGRIVLMDFGAGRIRAEQTPAGGITGTPLYLAPEVFNRAPATIASDIYSAGVLLFHLVTTEYPVEGHTLTEVETAHARGERQWLADLRPDLPASFVQVVERAIARDPAQRYRSSDEMRQHLIATLEPHKPIEPAPGRHTTNARAYQSYLKGRFYWTRRYHGGLKAALDHFKNAIEEDAGYALAYAGLADVYSFMGIYGVQRPRSVLGLAAESAERALAIDPDLPEAYTSLALIRVHEWNLPAAARAFARALELDPRQAVTRVYYSWLLVLQRDIGTAIRQVREAQEVDPLAPLVNAGAGHTYYLARRYEEAIAECEKAVEIDPNFILAIHVMGMCRSLQGQLDEAVTLGERTVDMSARAPFYLGMLGHHYARVGAHERVQRVLDELGAMADQRYVPPHCMTYIYAGLNDLDKAFEWQAKAEQDGASPFYYVSPLLEKLQRDPRHADQMRRMGWTGA
jgi:eukaryotic-like serine/threonine-protein kinase